MRTPKAGLSILDYYIVETLCSFSATLLSLSIFFWTRQRFGFSNAENLLLNGLYGLAYIPCALYGGRLADRIGPDRLLKVCLAFLTVLTLSGWLAPWRWFPFALMALYNIAMAPCWPALESAVLHAPSTLATPSRLGAYNVGWAGGGAIAFFASGAIFAWSPDAVIWIPGLLHAATLGWMALRRPAAGVDRPQPGAVAHASDRVPRPTKRRFMRIGWAANSLGYLQFGVLSALTPHLGERLHLPPTQTIWLASVLLFARTGAFVLFWLWEGWHYRMFWSQLSLWLLPLAFGVIFVTLNPIVVLVALAFYGLVFGLAYSASIYYSLDYGQGKGEHGGLHEAVLGVGIMAGPLIGAAGAQATGRAEGAVAAALAVAVASAALVCVVLTRRRSIAPTPPETQPPPGGARS